MSRSGSPEQRRNEQNDRAWNNPANWVGPRWLGIYRSRDDDRLFVPRAVRFTGWSLNLGHPWAVWLLFGTTFIFVAFACAVTMLN